MATTAGGLWEPSGKGQQQLYIDFRLSCQTDVKLCLFLTECLNALPAASPLGLFLLELSTLGMCLKFSLASRGHLRPCPQPLGMQLQPLASSRTPSFLYPPKLWVVGWSPRGKSSPPKAASENTSQISHVGPEPTQPHLSYRGHTFRSGSSTPADIHPH